MSSFFLNHNLRLRIGWKITITLISFVVLSLLSNLIFTVGYSAYLFSTEKVGLESPDLLSQYLQTR